MRNFFLATAFLALAAQAFAQHEVSVGGGLGLSALQYGGSSGAFGGNVGLGYSYRFNDTWALRSGLDVAFYGASYKGNPTEVYALPSDAHNTPAGYQFLYTANVSGADGKQRATYLHLPIMGQYKREVGNYTAYGAAGIKLGIPLGGTYSGTASEVTTIGYSEYTHQQHVNEPQHGFSTYQHLSGSGNLDLKFGVWLSLEGGMVWSVAQRYTVYTGLYFDYALSSLLSGGTYVGYNGANAPTLGSSSGLSGSMGAMAVGVTARFAFDPVDLLR